MEYLDTDMEDFCGDMRRLVDWLNTSESAPIVFAEPGFRQDLFTVPQPFIELYLATEGGLHLQVGPEGTTGVSADLRQGEMAIANAHFGNRGGEIAGAYRYGCISLALPREPQFATWTQRPYLTVRRVPDLERIRNLYVDVAQLYHGPNHPYREILLKSTLLMLCAHAGDPGAGQSLSSGLQNVHVRRAVEIMQEKRSDPKLTLTKIARHAQVSPSHLVRLFQSNLDTSPMRYLTQVRIRHAQGLLLRSQLTIKEIAHLAGFSDQLYFSRVFRSETGSAPRDFRRSGS